MSGFPPNSNNAPLEFGNRLGNKGPSPIPDRGSRERSAGGVGRGLLAAGGYRSDGNGGGEFNQRRNDGGRRSRRDDDRGRGRADGGAVDPMGAGQQMNQNLMGQQPKNAMNMGLLGNQPVSMADNGATMQGMVAPGNMGGNMGGNMVGNNMGNVAGMGTPIWDVQAPGVQPGSAPMMGGGGNMAGYNMSGDMGNNMGYNAMGGTGPDPAMMMTSGQYNLLPAGMPQPLYPQLPGTWMPDGNFVPIKEVIACTECMVEPPSPNARPPVSRERPSGCRTAFIGGLPEKITEDILRDVFQRCGEITSIRMSQKNFAHIRFALEVYVEYALMLSGYRMKIRGESDPAHSGRIHVDYAQARDDMYEWECQQRVLQREMRHRQRQMDELTRPPSPPPVTHYSHHEASQLMEKIKDEGTFGESVQLLTQWLERGDCNKRTAGSFYSLIQSTNSHVRRLMSERSLIEEELNRMREQARMRQQQIVVQFGQIEHVFVAACQQKVWDHFSKAQRKNIELWKKQAMEIKKVQLDELQGSGEEADQEMDLSDDEEPGKKRARRQGFDPATTGPQALASAAAAYAQQEMSAADEAADAADALRCQVEAYKNEAEMARFEQKEEMEAKENEMAIMRTTMQNVQKQLLASKTRESALEKQLRELRTQVAKLKLKKAGDEKAEKAENTENAEAEDGEEKTEEEEEDVAVGVSGLLPVPLDGKDARIIGLAAAFLNVHPDGASPDYLWSYLQQFPGYVSLTSRDVETVLTRYDRVFKESISGVGAKLERKWCFIGYAPQMATE